MIKVFVWCRIAVWPWLSFGHKIIVVVWDVQAEVWHNRKTQKDKYIELLRRYLGPWRFEGENTDIKYIVENRGRIQSWQFSFSKSRHSRGILSHPADFLAVKGSMAISLAVGHNISLVSCLINSMYFCVLLLRYSLLGNFLSACLNKRNLVSECCSASTVFF